MRRSELLAKAMEDVRACRQRAVTLAERNKQRAYDKVPRLLVLDNLTIETGLALARLAAARAPESALAEKRAALNAIEIERAALLAENGFAADFLQPHFHCRFCQDTGTTANGLCGCVEERIRALRREELLGIAPLSECRFDNFDLLRYPDIIVPPQRDVYKRQGWAFFRVSFSHFRSAPRFFAAARSAAPLIPANRAWKMPRSPRPSTPGLPPPAPPPPRRASSPPPAVLWARTGSAG